jgi:phosphatidylserine/phosphatidylglycerophosphate/cardiolipin synthase-like enzyme
MTWVKNMQIEFPILTVPSKEIRDYLKKLEIIANSEFSEAIILSPFVDAHIVLNFVKRCVFTERKLWIITRYRGVPEPQQEAMDEAKREIIKYSAKGPTLSEKVKWKINERLHAKCVIIDWEKILLGSQNLTQFGGLGNKGKGNYELGIYIKDLGKPQIRELQVFFDEVKRTSTRDFYP